MNVECCDCDSGRYNILYIRETSLRQSQIYDYEKMLPHGCEQLMTVSRFNTTPHHTAASSPTHLYANFSVGNLN